MVVRLRKNPSLQDDAKAKAGSRTNLPDIAGRFPTVYSHTQLFEFVILTNLQR